MRVLLALVFFLQRKCLRFTYILLTIFSSIQSNDALKCCFYNVLCIHDLVTLDSNTLCVISSTYSTST